MSQPCGDGAQPILPPVAEPSADLARRFRRVYIKALQGHQRPFSPRQTVDYITVATCDLAELTYLRELREAIIEAGAPPKADSQEAR